jgi:hypothetical protein
MGADKKSSPKSRTRLCPKITSKGSHTNLPRSHSHNEHTNLGTSANTTQSGSTTQEAKDLGNLQRLGRTVRMEMADRPQGLGGLSAKSGRSI